MSLTMRRVLLQDLNCPILKSEERNSEIRDAVYSTHLFTYPRTGDKNVLKISR
jgi:hypothetical protein